MVSWLAAVEASPWRTVGAPQADLRTALEMARASLDLAEQLSAAQRELVEVREAAAMECRRLAQCYDAAGNDIAAMAALECMDAIAALGKERGNE